MTKFLQAARRLQLARLLQATGLVRAGRLVRTAWLLWTARLLPTARSGHDEASEASDASNPSEASDAGGSRLPAWAARWPVRCGWRLRGEEGMSTAEYAVGTVAAVAFAAVLFKIVHSSAVSTALSRIVTSALNVSL